MDVFDIGEGDLQALAADREKKKGRQVFYRKSLFPSIHLHQEILWGLSGFTPSSIPNESCFFKPTGANKTSVHQLEVNKSKYSKMQIQMVRVKGRKEKIEQLQIRQTRITRGWRTQGWEF